MWKIGANYGTYSETPQGGIISPILANSYLHELDKFVMKLQTGFDVYEEKNYTQEYAALRSKQTTASIIRNWGKVCHTCL